MGDERSTMGESPPADETAVEAFSRLDARIAAMDVRLAVLTRAIEHIFAERQSIDVPDYGGSLSAIAGQMAEMRKAIERTSRAPMLQVTPKVYAAEIIEAGEDIRHGDALLIRKAITAMENAVVDMSRDQLAARSAKVQRAHVIRAAIFTGIVTAVVMSMIPGMVARALPRSWKLPEKMAARILDESTLWRAGERLMQADSEAAWQGLMEAAKIWQLNREAFLACHKAAAKTEGHIQCRVQIGD